MRKALENFPKSEQFTNKSTDSIQAMQLRIWSKEDGIARLQSCLIDVIPLK